MNILNSKSKLLNLVIAGFPRPPASMAGLSVEELRTMEGIERENIEARIQWLRDIQSLLDGAMLLINQYNTVAANSRYVFRAVEIPCLTCPTWSHFIQDKLTISIYLSLDTYKICIKLIKFCIK